MTKLTIEVDDKVAGRVKELRRELAGEKMQKMADERRSREG